MRYSKTVLIVLAGMAAVQTAAQASMITAKVCQDPGKYAKQKPGRKCDEGSQPMTVICDQNTQSLTSPSAQLCVPIALIQSQAKAIADRPLPVYQPSAPSPAPATTAANPSMAAKAHRSRIDNRLDCALPPQPAGTKACADQSAPRAVHCDFDVSGQNHPVKLVCGNPLAVKNFGQGYQRCLVLLANPEDVSPSGVVLLAHDRITPKSFPRASGDEDDEDTVKEDHRKIKETGAYSITPAGNIYFHACANADPKVNRSYVFPGGSQSAESQPVVQLGSSPVGSSHWGDSRTPRTQPCVGESAEGASSDRIFTDKLESLVNAKTIQDQLANDHDPQSFWMRKRENIATCRGILNELQKTSQPIDDPQLLSALGTATALIDQVYPAGPGGNPVGGGSSSAGSAAVGNH